MAKAANTVFVIRGTEGNETIVQTFRSTEDAKTPLKAAKKFLRGVADNAEHELHSALLAGELSYVGGHPVAVGVENKPSLTGL